MTNLNLQTKNLVGILSLAAMLFLGSAIFFVIPSVSATSNKIPIYFYSSETNINNFKSLKMEFDRYLSRFGPYEFQPFLARDEFEKHAKEKERCLLLLSSWHFRSINEAYSLAPVLAGVREGQKYHKRVLVTIAEDANIDTLKAGPIASASSTQHTSDILREMLKEKYHEAQLNVLTVPKDIDALMSVGFGMSKSAMTSQNSLKQLERINPKLFARMAVLAESEESLLLILAVPEGFEKEAKGMVNIFNEMPTDPDGKEKIRMLGLDGWQKLDMSDKLKLEAK
jgi:hypothetical protein